MYKVTVFFIFVLVVSYIPVAAQVAKYWVQLSDKNNSSYKTYDPESFLSKKAIERRTAQGIKIDSDDLPVSPVYLTGISSAGAKIIHALKWSNGVLIAEDDTSTLTAIKALPYVLSVKSLDVPDMVNVSMAKWMDESFIPFENVEMGGSNKTSGYNYGPSFNQINMISGNVLHDAGLSGQGKVIALFDAGFFKVNTLPAFDSLRINNQLLGTWDFVTGNNSVYEDNEHGMQALSAIAGYLPGQLVGTAPKASFWLFRTEVASTESIDEEYNWAAAAEFADSVGADIISSSLGYNTFDNASQNHSYSDMNGDKTPVTIAADKAAAKGILVIVSAGNEGATSWKYIIAPADGDSVIAVGAVDENKVKASFSSVGPSSDKRIKPNVAVQGKNVVVASSNGGTALINGTSFACPIVAGMAACLWQGHDTLSNMAIFKIIEKSCDHYNTPDSLTGFGIPNFATAHTVLSSVISTYGSTRSLQVYPNPFVTNFKLDFYSEKSGPIIAEIFDSVGKILLSVEKNTIKNATFTLEFNEADQLATGIYVLKLSGSGNSYVHKLVKF